MPQNVFISYADKDQQIASAVCTKLEQRGVTCWIASRDVAPGTDSAKSATHAIETARAMVLILSSESNSSPLVRDEVVQAFLKGIPILPFCVEHVTPSTELKMYVNQYQAIDATAPPLDPHILRLADAVNALLGNLTQPAQPPREEGGTERSNSYDVFVCHSTKDKKIANTICARLESAGIRCWIAPRDIGAGNYGANIIKAIKSTRAFVLVLSRHSNVSPHVHNEVANAAKKVAKEGVIIPFRIHLVDLAPELEYYLTNQHCIDAMEPPCDERVQELVQKLKMCL